MRVENDHILSFLFGGKCECVIHNSKTGNKFNFKIQSPENSKSLYFVHTDVDGKNVYAGFIGVKSGTFTYCKGTKGLLDENALPIKALMYVIKHHKALPEGVEVLHVGKCSRCGRKLTNPESIHTGLGPECFKKVKAIIG